MNEVIIAPSLNKDTKRLVVPPFPNPIPPPPPIPPSTPPPDPDRNNLTGSNNPLAASVISDGELIPRITEN